MLDPKALDAVTHIICHDSCSDGTASAMLLRDVYPDVPIQFMQYNTDALRNLEAKPGLLFCDFSPPPDRVKEFADVGTIVLDHHKTARGLVEAMGDRGIFGDEKANPGVSGATLAFEHVWLPRRGSLGPETWVRRFAYLAGVRDTWQRQSPDWRAACEQSNVLYFVPNEEWLSRPLSSLAAGWRENYQWVGELLLRRQEADVAKACARGWHFTTAAGTRVVVLPSKSLVSDAAEYLDTSVDLVIGVFYVYEPGVDAHPKLVLSTRSHTTFDCAAFCQAHGGGGHTAAAGCTVVYGQEGGLDPFTTVRATLERYEARRASSTPTL